MYFSFRDGPKENLLRGQRSYRKKNGGRENYCTLTKKYHVDGVALKIILTLA